jgi:hypothetical protein
MSCEIIQFSVTARPARASVPPPATETPQKLRSRADAWRRAGRVVDYWRARMDWHSALEIAQRYGIADSDTFPSIEITSGFAFVEKWREAIAEQLLTPAPDLGAVAWKRGKLKRGDFVYLPIKAPSVEQVIAEDEAFLAAHPTRRAKKAGHD